MKLAVAYNNTTGEIADSFSEAAHFRVYEIQDSEVYCAETIGAMGLTDVEKKVGMISMLEADAVICGAVDHKARCALFDEGIELFALCCGNSDDAVDDFLSGRLDYES